MRALSEGSLVAGYRVEGQIAQGGMGILYRATQLSLDRTVALKVIQPAMAEDADFRARFIFESRIAASIDHPNLIPIHEADESDGVLFIAMRYVDGIDLARLLKRDGALEPAHAVSIVSQVAAALDAAHARGLVHRDVKPANVLISGPKRKEHVYLTDFGLVKRSTSPGGLTKTGQWVGTLDYVAPEQLKGDPVDGRADVYALGCLTYQALTGRVPYPRDEDVAKLWAHVGVPPPSLHEEDPGLPITLDRVISKSMAKAPHERFSSAGELSNAAAAAVTTQPAAEAPVIVPETTRRGAPPSVTRRPGRPGLSPVRVALAAVGLVAILVVTLLALSGGDEKKGAGGNPAGRVVGRPIPVGATPAQAAVGAGAVWVSNQADGTVSRIDPRTNAVVGPPIPVGGGPVFLAISGETVWVANSEGGTVTRIDGRSNRVVRTIPIHGVPLGIAAAGRDVWVADAQHIEVIRIDAATNQVEQRISVSAVPFAIAAGAGAVWVTNLKDNTLTKIDPETSRPVGKPLFVGTEPGGVDVGEGGVWVANSKDDTVVHVDPRSFKTVRRAIRVGRVPDSLAVGAGSVWVANESDGTVSRIDPRSHEVVGRPISVGRGPSGPDVGAGGVWVPNSDDNTVTRIAP